MNMNKLSSRIVLLISLLISTFQTGIFAQTSTVTIGTGTNTSYYYPYDTYNTYSTVQMVYDASEIGQEGIINSIAFKVSTQSSLSVSSLKIYFGYKSTSSFSSTSDYQTLSNNSTLQLVYSGSRTIGSATGWETIYLNTPFEYDGIRPLLVIICRNSSSKNTSLYYNNTSYSGIRTLYRAGTSSNYSNLSNTSYAYTSASYRPNVQFGFDYASYTNKGISYLLFSDKAIVTGTSLRGAITVPDSVIYSSKKYIVRSVGANAFGSDGITSVILSDSIVSLYQEAFYNCVGLDSIKLPSKLQRIGSNAFYNCNKLDSLYIPASVTSIGDDAFYNVSGLKKLVFEDGSTTLSLGYGAGNSSYGAFYNSPLEYLYVGRNLSLYTNSSTGGFNKSSLSKVEIGPEVTSIPSFCFYGCTKLDSLYIPASVTSIGNNAFQNVSGLKKLVFADGNTTLSLSYGGGSTSYGAFYNSPLEYLYIGRTLSFYSTSYTTCGFSNKTNLSKVEIGPTVASIPSYCFYGCSKLDSLHIPASVTSIGDNAFYNASGLKKLVFEDSNTAISLGYGNGNTSHGAFYNSPLEYLYMGRNISFYNTSYTTSGFNKTTLSKVEIGPKVTSIPSYCFYGCTKLDSLNIPASVTSISSNAFQNVSGLKKLVFADGNTTLSLSYGGGSSSYGAFYNSPLEYLYVGRNLSLYNNSSTGGFNRSSISKVEIGSQVTSIPSYCFYGCSKLDSLYIPASVTSIGSNAFQNVSGLKKLVFEDGNTTLSLSYGGGSTSYGAFYNSPLEYLYVGRNLSLYNYCSTGGFNKSSLVNVKIGSKVTSIPSYCFYGCTTLDSLYIPASVTSIGSNAFQNVSGLKKLVFEDGNTTLSLSYGGGSTSYGAFYNSPLEYLYVGRNLSLYNYCSTGGFNKSSLVNVKIGSKVTSIPSYCFYGCSGITDIKLTKGLSAIGSYAFYNCSKLTSLTIPDSVLAISSYTFANCTSLRDVSMNDSVSTIGSNAFDGCRELVNIKLPQYLRTIGNNAFGNNTKLTSISIPDSVIAINGSTFEGCSSLKYVHLGASVSSLGLNAFYGCSALERIELSDQLTTIGSQAFYNCSKLDSLYIPASVTSIGNNAFQNVSALKTLVFEDGSTTLTLSYGGGNTSYGAFYNSPLESLYVGRNLSLYSYSTYGGFYKTTLSEVEIGPEVTSIPSYCFYGCSKLDSLYIPASVTSIGNNAFQNVSGLKKLVFEDGSTTLSLGYGNNSSSYGAFYNSPLEYLYVGRNLSLYSNSSTGGFNKSSLVNIKIGSKVTLIPSYCFYGCSGITDIKLPKGLSAIGSYAFYNCSNLTSITIPDSVLSINSYTFANCSSLRDVSMHDSISSIGSYAFNGCSEIVNIKLPKYLRTLENYALSGCRGLTSITIPDSVSAIKGAAFEGCSSLKYVHLGASVSSLGSKAFYGCSALERIKLSDQLTSIGSQAFYGCSKLDSLYIPASVTSIGNDAFQNVSALKTLVFEDGSTTLTLSYGGGNTSYGAFYNSPLEYLYVGRNLSLYSNSSTGGFNKSSLVKVEIGSEVTSIPGYCFYNCSGLKYLSIGDTLLSIGNNAFANTGLTQLKIQTKTPPTLGTNDLSGKLVYVEKGCGPDYRAATYWSNAIIVDDADELVTVVVNKPGSFRSRFALQDLKLSDVTKLKITGKLNADDWSNLTYSNITQLYYLDLSGLLNDTIPAEQFKNNTSINTVILPSQLVSIDQYAFYNCSNLNASWILPNTFKGMGDYALAKSGIKKLVIPDTDNYEDLDTILNVNWMSPNTSTYSSADTTLTIKAHVGDVIRVSYSMPYSSYYGTVYFYVDNNNISSAYNTSNGLFTYTATTDGYHTVRIAYSKSRYTTYSVGECQVNTVEVVCDPNSNIGSYALNDCIFLDSVIIGNNNVVGRYAFSGDIRLIYAQLNKGVYLNEYAFSGCNSLETLLFGGANTIGPNSFLNNSSLNEVNILGENTTIGQMAFGNSGIRKLTLSEGIKSIGNSAFSNCTNLQGTVTIPSSINVINESLFNGCSKLERVQLHDNSLTIGDRAFYNCSKLESINIPNNVQSIGNYSFAYCSALKEIALPSSITSLGNSNGSFYNCSGLERIYAHWESPISIISATFNGVNYDDCKLIVPFDCADNYLNKSVWNNFWRMGEEYGKMSIGVNSGGSVVCHNKVISDNNVSIEVDKGDTINVMFIPDTDYELASVSLNSMSILGNINDSIYSIEGVEGPIDLAVLFKRKQHSFTVTANHGTVYVGASSVKDSTQVVKAQVGLDATLSCIPDEGYELSSFLLGTSDITDQILFKGEFVVPNVRADTTITATFVKKKYLLIADAGQGGSLSMSNGINASSSDSIIVRWGDSISVAFSSFEDYTLNQLTVNDSVVMSDIREGSFTYDSIDDNLRFYASFKKYQYNYEVSSNYGGYITFNDSVIVGDTLVNTKVTANDRFAFAYVPYEGYELKKCLIGGAELSSMINDSISIDSAFADTTIQAVFGKIQYIVDFTISEGGSVNIDKQLLSNSFKMIEWGDTLVFEISEDENMLVDTVMIDGRIVTKRGQDYLYSINNIKENHDVFISFKVNPLSIEYNMVDGVHFSNDRYITTKKFTYSRYYDESWEILLLPVSLSYSDWCNDFELAYLMDINVHDDTYDGVIDRSEVEAVLLTENYKTEPNCPYLIRAKSPGKKIIELYNCRIAPSEPVTISFSNALQNMNLVGSYEPITSEQLRTMDVYQLVDGEWILAENDVNEQAPMRAYLEVTNKSQPYIQIPQMRQIPIKVVGSLETQQYSINVVCHNGGHAMVTDSVVLYNHSAILYTIPDYGYEVERVYINGVDFTKDLYNGNYCISNITSNINVEIFYLISTQVGNIGFDINDIDVFDIMGRKVDVIEKGKVYIINGKRYYIMDN